MKPYQFQFQLIFERLTVYEGTAWTSNIRSKSKTATYFNHSRAEYEMYSTLILIEYVILKCNFLLILVLHKQYLRIYTKKSCCFFLLR